MANPQQGWYPDPQDSQKVRWWDGTQWTEHTQPHPHLKTGSIEVVAAADAAEKSARAEAAAHDDARPDGQQGAQGVADAVTEALDTGQRETLIGDATEVLSAKADEVAAPAAQGATEVAADVAEKAQDPAWKAAHEQATIDPFASPDPGWDAVGAAESLAARVSGAQPNKPATDQPAKAHRPAVVAQPDAAVCAPAVQSAEPTVLSAEPVVTAAARPEPEQPEAAPKLTAFSATPTAAASAEPVIAAEPAVVVPHGESAEPAARVVAEPDVAEPVVAEPDVAEPVVAEPVVAEPVAAEPVVAEPVAANPVVAEPAVVVEPVVAEPRESSAQTDQSAPAKVASSAAADSVAPVVATATPAAAVRPESTTKPATPAPVETTLSEVEKARLAEAEQRRVVSELTEGVKSAEAAAQIAEYELHLLTEESSTEEQTLAEAIQLATREAQFAQTEYEAAQSRLRIATSKLAEVQSETDQVSAAFEGAKTAAEEAKAHEVQVTEQAKKLLAAADAKRQAAIARTKSATDAVLAARTKLSKVAALPAASFADGSVDVTALTADTKPAEATQSAPGDATPAAVTNATQAGHTTPDRPASLAATPDQVQTAAPQGATETQLPLLSDGVSTPAVAAKSPEVTQAVPELDEAMFSPRSYTLATSEATSEPSREELLASIEEHHTQERAAVPAAELPEEPSDADIADLVSDEIAEEAPADSETGDPAPETIATAVPTAPAATDEAQLSESSGLNLGPMAETDPATSPNPTVEPINPFGRHGETLLASPFTGDNTVIPSHPGTTPPGPATNQTGTHTDATTQPSAPGATALAVGEDDDPKVVFHDTDPVVVATAKESALPVATAALADPDAATVAEPVKPFTTDTEANAVVDPFAIPLSARQQTVTPSAAATEAPTAAVAGPAAAAAAAMAPAVPQVATASPQQAAEPQLELASAASRLAANVVDYVIYVLISAGLATAVLLGVWDKLQNVLEAVSSRATMPESDLAAVLPSLGIAGLVATLVPFLYHMLLVRLRGATFGMSMMGLRVVPIDRLGALSWGSAAMRSLVKYPLVQVLGIPVIGYLWCLWDGDRQCWHDKAANSVVINND